MNSEGGKFTFFRQSGWMVLANTACGVFMAAVHPIASAMPTDEYGVFYSMLRVFTLLTIPAAGLQTVFAQQAASAVTEDRKRELAGTTRAVFRSILVLWLVMAGVTFLLQDRLVATLKMKHAGPLWITLAAALAALWLPVMQGLLQGFQNFLCFGFSLIFNGVGRFGGTVIMVWMLHGWAAGALIATLIGFVGALVISGWNCTDLLRMDGPRLEWRPWLNRVIPLTCGVGASLFMMNADMVVVQSYFPKDVTAFYAPGAMIGVALVTFTTPLAAVMFPKIVRSIARSETTHALPWALAATALLGVVGALMCTLFPEMVLRVLYFGNRTYLKAATLVPWFTWCMVPVTVANVLIGNLLARGKYSIVPWLVAIALGYGITLVEYAKAAADIEPFHAFRTIVQILGAYSLLLLLAAGCFTFRERHEPLRSL